MELITSTVNPRRLLVRIVAGELGCPFSTYLGTIDVETRKVDVEGVGLAWAGHADGSMVDGTLVATGVGYLPDGSTCVAAYDLTID